MVWLLRSFFKYLLALLVGLIYGVLSSIFYFFFASIPILLFPMGFYRGFKSGFNAVTRYFDPPAPPAPTPAVTAPPTSTPAVTVSSPKSNSIIKILEQKNPLIKLLTQEEIDAFQVYCKNASEHQEAFKTLLEHYLEQIEQGECPISYTEIKVLEQPVTIEGIDPTKPEKKKWVHIYDENSIRTWIKTRGSKATEPITRYRLTHPAYKIVSYQGWPDWVCEFIMWVRSILTPASSPTPPTIPPILSTYVHITHTPRLYQSSSHTAPPSDTKDNHNATLHR